jgi:mannose-1-phosphate guanylyltransferase/phosphomannomutase
MKAVVMAGGEGSRLRPLTSRRPKPLAPVANKPVMHHIIDLLRRHGITEVIATLHYMADEIETYFGDGSEFGVRMHYVIEDTPLGTAGAVKLAQPYFNDETLLVISGDALTDIDLTTMIRRHRETESTATITLQRVSNPLEFGVVVTDTNGRIERFLEKPSWGEVFSDTINTGIYALEPSIFDLMESGKIYDFSKDIFPQLLHQGQRLHGHVNNDYWTDIGSLEQFAQANLDALASKVRIEPAGIEISKGVWVAEGARIHPDAEILGPVVIGSNASIESKATIGPSTTIGDSSIVASGARVSRSTIFEDCYIGESANVESATIADRNILKDRVRIGEASVIGKGCIIGSGALVGPHLKIWPEKTIASGAIVSMSLIYGSKWPGSLFGSDGVSGLANIEITPEFAIKLGQAIGSSLHAGQMVVTSRDTHNASRIANRCIISGLLSVGVDVSDLRSSPGPLSRYAARIEGDGGGVHVRVSPRDSNSLLIEIYDGSGVNINKTVERKIENLFFREDFRRTSMDDVGRLSFPPRTLERYSSGFLSALRPQALKSAGFRVVIDYAFGSAASILPGLLGALGVEMVALNAYPDDSKLRTYLSNRGRHIEQLQNIVQTLDANLGILIDHDAEAISLVDDKGRALNDDGVVALVATLVARRHPKARIAVPITAPQAIEIIAEKYDAQVIRTRSERRATVALAQEEGGQLDLAVGGDGGIAFPEFHPSFDGIYAAAKIMELLAADEQPLSALVDELPSWFLERRSVACPWERKGRIMRSLHEEVRGEHVDLIDGIRIRREGGWVLVLPDASDPIVKIVAEGGSREDARRFADEAVERVENLIGINA